MQHETGYVQDGSNMTGTDLCVNKPQSVPVIFEPPSITWKDSCCVGVTLRISRCNDEDGFYLLFSMVINLGL